MSTQVLTVFTKDIEGRGKGFISSRKIKAGELICQERAAFVLDTEEINRQTVARELSRLGRDKQREFSDLRSKTGGGEELEVFLNNAINTDSHSDSQQFGLFLKIARINHSCCPNAGRKIQQPLRETLFFLSSVWGSTEDSEVLEVRAVQEIPPATEITVDYIGDKSFLSEPKQRLG